MFVGKHSCDSEVVEGSSIFGLGLSLAGVKESSEFKKPSALVLWGIVFFSTHSIESGNQSDQWHWVSPLASGGLKEHSYNGHFYRTFS